MEDDADDDLIALLDVPDVLHRNISKSQLYKWVNVGLCGRRLKTERRGNRRFVHRAELVAFLRDAYGDR